MFKYLYVKEVFREIPDEISLAVSISGCRIRCPGCHSRELWQDIGRPLTWDSLNALIHIHRGVTCLLLMGGERDIPALAGLFRHARRYVKTAWYCGLDSLPDSCRGILRHLDYIKLGHYDKALGGLDSPKTNQRLYLAEHAGEKVSLRDITQKFWPEKVFG